MLPSAPRVFVSYARSDGKDFARRLSKRLQAVSFSLWRDLADMEGGRDWWQQIEEAIRAVEYLLLVMTPAALRSDVVRKEWRFARQEGRCVIPVLADPSLPGSEAFKALPGWMQRAHFVDTDNPEQWTRLLRTLEKPCEVRRVPFMAGDWPEGYVEREREREGGADRASAEGRDAGARCHRRGAAGGGRLRQDRPRPRSLPRPTHRGGLRRRHPLGHPW